MILTITTVWSTASVHKPLTLHVSIVRYTYMCVGCVWLSIASSLSYSLRPTPTKRPAHNTIYHRRSHISYEQLYVCYGMIYVYSWFITFILCSCIDIILFPINCVRWTGFNPNTVNPNTAGLFGWHKTKARSVK
mgnify:CR=1 FL=1